MIWEQIWGFFADPDNWGGTAGIPNRIAQHLGYTALVILIAAAIAFPLGALIGHTGKGSWIVINIANGARALPTLGLLTLLVLLLGLGLAPAVIGLVVLAVPPLLTATYAGIRGVNKAVVDAARGMGMSELAILFQVEIPLGWKVILGGLRSGVLQVIATATVAAYIALGGLGRFILDGLALRDYGKMAGGAILVALLALLADLLFYLVGKLTDRQAKEEGPTKDTDGKGIRAKAAGGKTAGSGGSGIKGGADEDRNRGLFAETLELTSAEAEPPLSSKQ